MSDQAETLPVVVAEFPAPRPTQTEMRAKVHAAEAVMFKQPQVNLPVTHHFAQGMYGRELFIPAGILLTGKIHKYPQLNILSQGELSVLTEEGVKRVKAPFHIVSPAGTKRIAYAHTDCTWTTIHQTELRDVDEIEAHFIVQSEAEYLDFCKALENKS